MKRWLLPVLALALLMPVASTGSAQPKDTLTVALVSHALTLDPHMHFERVGILVNINMFDSLLHRNTKLSTSRRWPRRGRRSTTRPGSSSSARA